MLFHSKYAWERDDFTRLGFCVGDVPKNRGKLDVEASGPL